LKNESLKYGLRVNVHKTKYLKCSRRQDQLQAINIENKEIEQVRSCKYLGSTVNTDNKIEEEIKERLALGNKAFFSNKKIFQSKLISKNAKTEIVLFAKSLNHSGAAGVPYSLPNPPSGPKIHSVVG